jgi:hypothetical protein
MPFSEKFLEGALTSRQKSVSARFGGDEEEAMSRHHQPQPAITARPNFPLDVRAATMSSHDPRTSLKKRLRRNRRRIVLLPRRVQAAMTVSRHGKGRAEKYQAR